ncbi:HpcH/HpaI aldolase [Rhizodiscina lignyota]|uniref:HpcH/HpaI aldolase n=1 Tax=Rhizodiscina lignyota TaxID=1504668 RepID=A0A9P4IC24_9PEZI|nr:HpcH/HpaI aldolase [Rhizodiscina lignyota]
MADEKIPNYFREKMQRGEVASTLSVKMVRTNDIIMMAKSAGFDGVMIDMEHSSFDFETTSQLCIAALGIGITPIVRSPSKNSSYIARILDGGALGVIVPHVKTVQDVKDIVEAAKFTPVGKRSAGGGLPHLQYRSPPAEVANSLCNEATLVIPMIETLEALEAVNEIAAVPGVDALFMGSSDMTAEMGIPGEYDNKKLMDAYERMISACTRNGKFAGVGGLQTRLDLAEKVCGMGAGWISSAMDSALLFGAVSQKGKEMKELNNRVQQKSRK